MEAGITAMLTNFPHMFEFGPALMFITCISVMALYLFKIVSEVGGAVRGNVLGAGVMQHTPAQLMASVHNPFVVSIMQPSKASLTDGVTVSVSAKVPCTILPLWGVHIGRIYDVLHRGWEEFHEGFRHGLLHPMLDGHVLHASPSIHLPTPVHTRETPLPVPTDLDLGDPPRDKYPLVLVLLDQAVFEIDGEGNREAGAGGEGDRETGAGGEGGTGEGNREAGTSGEGSRAAQKVACMVCLIHVRDAVCPGESQIITQFVRVPHSPAVFNLQQLYVSGSDNLPSSSPSSSHPTTHAAPAAPPVLCVVCQAGAVTRAVLPCRHACLCRHCLPRLRTCPMCRAPITAYFSLGPGGETGRIEDDGDDAVGEADRDIDDDQED